MPSGFLNHVFVCLQQTGDHRQTNTTLVPEIQTQAEVAKAWHTILNLHG